MTYRRPESTDDLHDSVVASTMELILQPLAVRVVQGYLHIQEGGGHIQEGGGGHIQEGGGAYTGGRGA